LQQIPAAGLDARVVEQGMAAAQATMGREHRRSVSPAAGVQQGATLPVDEAYAGEYEPGRLVALRGLAAHSDHNGRSAMVVRRLDANTALHVVRFTDNSQHVVHRRNMAPYRLAAKQDLAVGALVVIDGVKSRAELNGTQATVREPEPDKGRYIVQLVLGGDEVSLKAEVLYRLCQ